MADIKEIEKQIISEFELLDDWMDKYNYIIELGKTVPLIDAKYKTKNNLISGCQSRVWLRAGYDDGLIKLTADSDAVITKGIISLLIRVLNNQTPDDILDAELDFVDKIGLREHLSPTRSNGLTSMIKQIKLYAMAYKAREQSKH
jgi:cysteine desulfuration protein SufE